MSKSLVVAMVVLVLGGCGDSETDKRGLELLPDMYHSPASKSQTAGTIQVAGRDAQGNPVVRQVQYPSMLTPPEGTIPRDFQPYPLAVSDLAGALQLTNPIAPTTAVLKRGQQDFLIFCAACHGRDGNAVNGYIAKQFSGIPSLNIAGTLKKSDGELYHVISTGRGRMMHFRAQLPSERRWGVVNFLKIQARAAVAESQLVNELTVLEAELVKKPNDPVLMVQRTQLVELIKQAKADVAGLRTAGDGLEFMPLPAPVPEYVEPSWPVPETTK
ncbi:MAG: cytochrome c [Planctomycetota bacterium]